MEFCYAFVIIIIFFNPGNVKVVRSDSYPREKHYEQVDDDYDDDDDASQASNGYDELYLMSNRVSILFIISCLLERAT